MSVAAGTRLGPYEIVSLIGAGGMGEVYRARDPTLNREVAIKVLPDLFATDPERLARFQREAQTLAALNHHNIAAIYGLQDVATNGGPHVRILVMELVEGEDLSARLARGAVPIDDTLSFARQIAEALEAAHEQGVIHRDLKPANVKVKPDGTVKVLDFGLAKALTPDVAGVPADAMTSPAMTQAGMILGTAAYMSPEQARGRAVDKRADIWAFGVVLFELLTGRQLFAGETVSDTIAAVLTRSPDLSLLPTAVPPYIRALLVRCLERDPKRRLRDIGDARIELEADVSRVAGASPADLARVTPGAYPAPGAAAPGAARARVMTWVSAALLVALVASLAAWWRAREQRTALPVIHFDIHPPRGTALNLSSRPAVAVSPDGSMLVFVAASGGVSRLYLRKRDEVGSRAIPGTDDASEPAFSPDGQWIAYVTSSEMRKVTVDGATNVSLASVQDPRGLAWVNDQTIVASLRVSTGLSLIPAGGGPSRDLTTIDLERGERSHRWPAATPDGNAVLFTVGTNANPDDYSESQIDAAVVATGERRHVLDAASFVRCTMDGGLIFMRNGVLYSVGFDARGLKTIGEPAAVLPGVEGDATTGAGHFSMSGDRTLAYVPGLSASNQRRLSWVDRAGNYSPIDIPPAVFNEPSVSPDGRRIAVVVGTSGRGDVWTYDVERHLFSRLTFEGRAATPSWSRDGETVYYAAIDPQGRETALMRKRVDGSSDATLIVNIPGRAYLGYIEPAERFAIVAVVSTGQGNDNDIVRLPISPSGPAVPITATRALEYAPAVSPDGRWLAYVSTASGPQEVYVREMDGAGQWQISTAGGVGPHWSADGRELFFREGTRQVVVSIETTPRFRAGPVRILFDGVFNWRTEAGMNYDVDSVTGRFLVVRPPSASGPEMEPVVRVFTNWTTSRGR